MGNGVDASDAGSFEARTSGEDEATGSEFFVVDRDGVRVEKISATIETSDAGGLERLFAIATGIKNSLALMGDGGGEAEGEVLVPQFWVRSVTGILMREIKSDGIRNITSVEIGATKEAAFYQGDALFSFGEPESGGGTSRAATENDVIKIVFFTHLYYFITIFINIS